jgi:hypothetical protein
MTDYQNPAWTEQSRFRGSLDDVIIVPLVSITLAANKLLRFVVSILIRLFDYAFPLAMQIIGFRSSRPGFLAMSSLVSYTVRCASFPFPRRNVISGADRSAGAGRGSGGRLAIGRSNKLYMTALKTAWHGCFENAGI